MDIQELAEMHHERIINEWMQWEEIEKGNKSCIDMYFAVDYLEKACKAFKANCRPYAIEELEKHPGKAYKKNNFEIKVVESAVKYDYSHNQYWKELNSEISYIKTRLKERENLIKSLKNSMAIVDPDSGEMYEVSPPLKTSTTTIKISRT